MWIESEFARKRRFTRILLTDCIDQLSTAEESRQSQKTARLYSLNREYFGPVLLLDEANLLCVFTINFCGKNSVCVGQSP